MSTNKPIFGPVVLEIAWRELKCSIFVHCFTALCSAGTYSSSGMEQCEGCPHGTYQPHRGMAECIACPKGTSTHKSGSITHMECEGRC